MPTPRMPSPPRCRWLLPRLGLPLVGPAILELEARRPRARKARRPAGSGLPNLQRALRWNLRGMPNLRRQRAHLESHTRDRFYLKTDLKITQIRVNLPASKHYYHAFACRHRRARSNRHRHLARCRRNRRRHRDRPHLYRG